MSPHADVTRPGTLPCRPFRPPALLPAPSSNGISARGLTRVAQESAQPPRCGTPRSASARHRRVRSGGPGPPRCPSRRSSRQRRTAHALHCQPPGLGMPSLSRLRPGQAQVVCGLLGAAFFGLGLGCPAAADGFPQGWPAPGSAAVATPLAPAAAAWPAVGDDRCSPGGFEEPPRASCQGNLHARHYAGIGPARSCRRESTQPTTSSA